MVTHEETDALSKLQLSGIMVISKTVSLLRSL